MSTLAGNTKYGLENGPANAAQFAGPSDVAVDAEGSVYVSDTENHVCAPSNKLLTMAQVIRMIKEGSVRTVCGSHGSSGFVDGVQTEASFNGPQVCLLLCCSVPWVL